MKSMTLNFPLAFGGNQPLPVLTPKLRLLLPKHISLVHGSLRNIPLVIIVLYLRGWCCLRIHTSFTLLTQHLVRLPHQTLTSGFSTRSQFEAWTLASLIST